MYIILSMVRYLFLINIIAFMLICLKNTVEHIKLQLYYYKNIVPTGYLWRVYRRIQEGILKYKSKLLDYKFLKKKHYM